MAAWLVARPLNAIIGLAAALSLPLLGFLSGAVLAYLVLAQGPRLALLEAGIAGALILGLAAVFGFGVEPNFYAMAAVWLPALAMALLLTGSRSLTLTLQVSVVVVLVGIVLVLATAGNAVDFWSGFLMDQVAQQREAGLVEQADQVEPMIADLAPYMTAWMGFMVWVGGAVMLLLGYNLYRRSPGEPRSFGRLCDLDFGRVLASVMVVASLLGYATGLVWIQSIAFVLFAVFSLQGVAIVHWLHASGMVPVFVVVLLYGALLSVVLTAVVFTAMAVLGYIDAWFRLRHRKVRPSGSA